jgi:hypothetical protein
MVFFILVLHGKPTFANSVDASTATSVNYNTGSNNILAYVIDNSSQEYVIKADAALGTDAATAQAKFGAANQMNTNNYTASSNNRWSIYYDFRYWICSYNGYVYISTISK